MTDLVVDVASIGNGFRDALAQQGLKPASETMHRGFDRAFRRLEPGRDGGVAAIGRLSEQARFELVEFGRPSLSCPLRAKVGEQPVDDRQRPAPLEERFGSCAILRFGDVPAFGILERDGLCVVLGTVMFVVSLIVVAGVLFALVKGFVLLLTTTIF